MPVVLITGSNSGIGMATALHLAAKGHRVHASMRSLERGGELRAAAAAKGLSLAQVELDVGDEGSVQRAVARVLDQEGRIDVLVNNAGVAPLGPIEEMSDATVRAAFETNVFGAIRAIRSVLPCMRRQRSGRIVNVSSVAGKISNVCSGIYAGTKFALEAVSEALAQEVQPFGIHVSLIEPGFIVTPLLGKSIDALPSPDASAYPNAVRISNGLFGGARKTGGTPETCAATIEEAITADPPKLRYPVGAEAQTLMDARARVPDEIWVNLGRHRSIHEYFAEFGTYFPPR